ncbi:MAG: tetratricopeptide repeat protein [Bacteroidota bacterium]
MIRWIILGVGALVFVLLLFADKTNLNSSDGLDIAAPTQQSRSALPPLAPDVATDALLARLDKAEGAERLGILDSIIVSLQARNRTALAADYAYEALSIDRSLVRLRQAGTLHYQATQLPYVAQDSILFRTYADRSITLLRDVTEQAPEDEDALINLGMALTTSRLPQNSMQGILTIRKVLEMNPDNTAASYQLGLFSMQTGQFDKAVSRFEKVLSLEPDNQVARYQLAQAYAQTNRAAEARSLLETVLEQAEDPELKRAAKNLLTEFN